ncbi:MAG: hypothetical protein IJP31_12490 [Lachnospiraceae bacterium]|nr:hypothetical protein [Lachnospiraceae bacterium]
MYLLTANVADPNAAMQPDYIALTLVSIMAVIVVLMVIRKHIDLKKTAQFKKEEVREENFSVSPITEAASTAVAPGSAGSVKIYDVDPKTAAMLMAIVADKMAKPLNELRFISIKEIK